MNIRKYNRWLALTVSCLLIPLTVRAAWQLSGDAAGSSLAKDTVSLALPGDGEVAATNELPVRAGARLALSFKYRGEGLAVATPLTVSVRWLDAFGKDVDEARRGLGFPPLARTWTFTKNKDTVSVADNVAVTERAAKAVVTLTVTRQSEGKGRGRLAVTVSDFQFKEGELPADGLELADSGPADAGPLSQPPGGTVFPENLVKNAALENGQDAPDGWKIEGDNSSGAAEWVSGGAFSGRRAFKLSDRGPYARSWDQQPGDPFVPGTLPTNNYAFAREEVSARWVSEPVPATPGKYYQISGWLWYANRPYLDRGSANPLRVQFLDQDGKVLRYATSRGGWWDDWMDDRPFTNPGWVFVPGRPVLAPERAVTLRAAVALTHAFWSGDAKDPKTYLARPDNRGFVLADNISVYPLPEGADVLSQDRAFQAACAAHLTPYVPSSPAHRPNTLNVSAVTDEPGGVLLVPRQADAPLPVIKLDLQNLLGDPRAAEVNYSLVNIHGKKVGQGSVTVSVPPFGTVSAPVALPQGLPLGPYLLEYSLNIKGEGSAPLTGSARFGLLLEREVTPEERGRMDYPFSLWMPNFCGKAGTPEEHFLGRLADLSGMGKTWFGTDMFHVHQVVETKDPAQRQAKLDTAIAHARDMIKIWRGYHITPIGGIQNTNLLDDGQRKILGETIETYISALKNDVKIWRYGTESIHGAATELDVATVEGRNGQGDSNYLFWGRQGTVRQYWEEYFIAYAAAKQADPDCVFGPQSASDVAGNVLRLFFQLGTNKQLDSFGMNTYISAFSIWPPNERQLALHGVPDLPIYISEFAAQGASPTAPDHLEKELLGSNRMVTYWSQVLRNFPNLFHAEMWGMVLGEDDGSLTFGRQARPQYYAYANMTEILGAGRFIQGYELPGVSVYVRERSVRKAWVAVVWSKEPDAQVELEVGDHAQLLDLWGNRLPLTVQNGVVTVSANPEPVYVLADQEIKLGKTVRLEGSHVTVTNGQYQVTVSVANERDAAVSGRLELIADGPLKVAQRQRDIKDLAAGQSVSEVFDVTPGDLAGRDRRVNIRARFVTGEKTYQVALPLNFNTAEQSAATVSDPQAPAWRDDELNLVADRREQMFLGDSSKPWGGPDDLSARAGFRWDEKNLYLIFKVTDDVFNPPAAAGGYLWAHDLIELAIDTNRTLTAGPHLTMFTLMLREGKPLLERWDGKLPKGEVKTGRISIKNSGPLTVYEAAIPWAEIDPDFQPAAGTAIALCWSVDDNDGADGDRRYLSWFAPVNSKNPATFGDLLLVKKGGGK
ncbi:MAG: hypothetical protein LBK76_09075 [Verrucomicrobiales bacterium]|jgi:hypothetical protein|nr:hypothetical protein [Verrucomicrobiales bacterium]